MVIWADGLQTAGKILQSLKIKAQSIQTNNRSPSDSEGDFYAKKLASANFPLETFRPKCYTIVRI